MKNWRKCFGIIAIVAVIGLLAACPDGGGDGDTLELSGQVYQEVWNGTYSYQNFYGNLTIPSSNGGSGTITNGILNYSIGKPSNLYTVNVEALVQFLSFNYWDNLQISKTSVKGFYINGFFISSNNYDYYLSKENRTYNGSANSSSSYEGVMYVYVEEDVTVNGSGKTETYTDDYDGVTYTTVSNDLNLTFKAGWNALYLKATESGNVTTITRSLSDPSSLRWVLSYN